MVTIHFDPASLHPNAAESIDSDGRDLIAARQIGTITRKEPAFKSRREITEELTDADITDEPLLAWSDLSGQTVGRYFPDGDNLIALRENGYRLLRRLVEKIGKTKPFSTGFSEQFLETEIFKWWRAAVRSGKEVPLSAHLLPVCAEAIAPRTLLVPLSNLEIERPFKIGDVLVTPIGTRLFDDFGEDLVAHHPEDAATIRSEALKLRREYGHLTAICVNVVGEREFANQRARMIANDMAEFFRFMSPAAASRNVVFGCFPYGCEHEPKTTVIEIANNRIAQLSSGVVHNCFFRWALSFEELDRYMKDGFQRCAIFFTNSPLTEFQLRVKTSISAYSQAIAATDVRNRLIYAMSAAEHLLLRADDGAIQSSVGERMAFLIAETAGDRREIVQNFKKAYGFRSRQVHHLAAINDEEVLDKFFQNMFLMLAAAMDHMTEYRDHQDFLDALDNIKFS